MSRSVKRKEFTPAELTTMLPLVLPIVQELRQSTLNLRSASRSRELLARQVEQRRGRKTRDDFDLDSALSQRQDECRAAIRAAITELSRLGADWNERTSAAWFPDAQLGNYMLVVDPFTDYAQGYVVERKWMDRDYAW
jgi:hypothetical protein